MEIPCINNASLILNFYWFCRLVKLSLPNYGDFELIFSQIQQFITVCSKEQIQFAGEKCKDLLKNAQVFSQGKTHRKPDLLEGKGLHFIPLGCKGLQEISGCVWS